MSARPAVTNHATRDRTAFDPAPRRATGDESDTNERSLISAARQIHSALLRWYDKSRRALPWRETSDPYRVWLSEVMLQQTRVETVIDYYARFTRTFPTVQALAIAPLDDVLRLWSGLGYYSRAKNLHAAARAIVNQYDGEFPTDAAALRALPGVGRYTAGAIASIAFGRRAAVVDGNVKRVLARLLNLQTPIDDRAVVEGLWLVAEALTPARRPGDFNQAIMELGATVCLPRQPACAMCPLRAHCAALRKDSVASVPARVSKRPPRLIEAAALAVWRDDRLLAMPRPPRGLLGGLWRLPQIDGISPGATPREIAEAFGDAHGLRVEAARFVGEVKHQFTHRTLCLRIHAAAAAAGARWGGVKSGRWVTPAEFELLPISTLDRRVIEVVRAAEPERGPRQSTRRAGRSAASPVLHV
ncbi:MAG: A/G-specific adenine glycosylase [Phycisphaerales bacterium]|nr:A/G-specific adenine glycosylase [Phycisphaerales bacterium]